MKFNAIAVSLISSIALLGGVVSAQVSEPHVKVQAATSVATKYAGQRSVPIYSTPNGTKTGKTLSYGSSWKVFATQGSWIEVGTNQWVNASAMVNTKPANTYYIDYKAGYGIATYSTPNGKSTGKSLKHGTAWKAVAVQNAGGKTWIELGKGSWINAAYTSTSAPKTKYIKYKSGYSIAVRSTPNGSLTGGKVKDSSAVTAFQTSGNWTNIGYNQWVESRYLSSTKPNTIMGYETTGVAYRMNATAYDPRVLGNTTFGYDTVAANLSRFPRYTKLAIKFGNGKTKIYIVRDTGGFAYSNPNQLDIAMPNSQALQFGRQNITVWVLK
ncbi:3D domain-containing protein [Lacticaseibacillus pabuli]|uniref:3D domain-containing protein n=1 Tax=Lacticaseibacillus pabuli TaxID=3025672 RepID=A0ABY7WUP5_9LACO|nr:3D domain-containing protein [Lacticaseibacillus sp. KACC 23028]WDF83494.1 3D domain-containing protein [Lacticaseibacillus sp. KACC 23028]